MDADEQAKQGPLRFLIFLVLVAALLAYAADRWESYHEATFGEREAGIWQVWDRSSAGDDAAPEADSGEADEGEDEGTAGDEGYDITDVLPGLDRDPLTDGELPDLTEQGESLTERLAEGVDFAEQRLERDRMRSRQLDMLLTLSQDRDANQQAREEARSEMVRLHEAMTVESELEHLLRLQGFDDVFALRHRQGVIVIVAADELDVTEVRAIAGLAQRVAGVDREAIGIMTHNPAG